MNRSERTFSASDVGMSPQPPTNIDPAAWVDEHGNALFRFAFMRLRDESLAEDMVQDTLLSAIQSLQSYRGKSAERTWLTGILKHKIIDHYRRNSRQVQITDEDTDLSDVDYFFERQDAWNGHWAIPLRPVDPEQSPEQVLERSEFWGVLNECLSALPARVANVFTLREMDGMSSDEICGVLSLSTSNFWVIMHRARMHLRRCVEVKWFRTV
ncbi:MAG: sigma-70 family RNA polymerase sigma factor [Pyrinomonadaceae bacterium]